MKRTVVISPVLLLAIAAAVGAGYMPTDDPLRMMDTAKVSSLVSVRSQRQAARQWLDEVVRTFGKPRQHHPVGQTAMVTELATALNNLHLSRDRHDDRALGILSPQQPSDWLLNLPPPAIA